jgi:hypothetical protein
VDFLGAGDPQVALDRDRLGEIKAERGRTSRAGTGDSELQQIASGQLLHA